jgi:hypothetical protein
MPMRRSYVVPMRWMVIYEYDVPGEALNPRSTKLSRAWSPWGSSLSRKNPHGRTGNRTRDLMISSQKLWPRDWSHCWNISRYCLRLHGIPWFGEAWQGYASGVRLVQSLKLYSGGLWAHEVDRAEGKRLVTDWKWSTALVGRRQVACISWTNRDK